MFYKYSAYVYNEISSKMGSGLNISVNIYSTAGFVKWNFVQKYSLKPQKPNILGPSSLRMGETIDKFFRPKNMS